MARLHEVIDLNGDWPGSVVYSYAADGTGERREPEDDSSDSLRLR